MYIQTTTTVPNGTTPRQRVATTKQEAATTPKYQTYVENFRVARKKSSESILSVCKIVVEAESQLKKADFKKFLEGIDVEADGSTFRKLRKIGAASERLKPHSTNLPTSWTTIYQIASLAVQDFERLVEEKMLTPKLTATQLRKHFSPCKPSGIPKTATVKVTARNIDASILAALRQEIESLCARHSVQVEFSQRVENPNARRVGK
jgi:hypothetical protein